MRARAEAFLGQRKTTSPAKFDKHVMEFRQTSRVLLVKPWWMPRALYDRLMRSIVIKPRDVESR